MILVRGGLFGGKRKSEELKFVGKNDLLEYEGSLEMMQRYINHLGRQVPSHLWRLGTEKRAVERARKLIPGATINNINDILPEAEKANLKGSKKYKFLHDMVNQIKNVNAIPTDEEIAMASRYEKIGNALEGYKGLEWAAKYFYRASQRKLNIADQIRGVTFTHMLGMYNPAQFLVQFSGSFVAFAVNPGAAIKAMPKFIGWQMLDGFANNPIAQKKAADWLRSQGMGDYADSYMIWAKSGFREAVTDSNSDIATLFGKKPYNANVLQKAMANNTLFYEMGELAMSRASVATAVEWYKSVNKVKKIDINDQKALKAIYDRAEVYRLNMGKANKSALNTGWKAVPFQFQQVISKYFEKVLPKGLGGTDELTAAEKIRLFAIPTAMTGAASIPGSSYMAEAIAGMAGVDLTQLSPDEVELWKGGAIGWGLSEALDVNVDFASRMALGSDIMERTWESAMGGGVDALTAALGPSGHILSRYTRGSQYTWEAINLTRKMEISSTDQVVMMSKVIADALSSLPSGARNMKQYMPHIIATNPAFYREGKYLWDWEDMNTQTAVMASLGFQPHEMQDIYDLASELQGTDSAKRVKLFKEDHQVVAHILGTAMYGTDDEEKQRIMSMAVQAILQSYDPADAKDIVSKARKMMLVPDKEQYSLFRKAELHNLQRMENGLNFINRMFSRKLQEREAD
jgi:hypothetical protein